LKASQEKSDQTAIELQKQKELNERLESDLLTTVNKTSIQQSQDKDDILASLSIEERSVC
jgi:hypothetical protein